VRIRFTKSPGYFFAATITLALAVAAAGAIAGAVHGLLLGSIGILRPSELVIAWETHRANNAAVVEVSYRNFQNWQSSSRSFSHVAAIGSSSWSMVLEGRSDPVKLATTAVSGSFFDTLGTRPSLGRLIQPQDDRPGQPRLVVLSHALWQHRFGGDPSVVGTTIQGDGIPATVVGVAAPDFDFPRGTDVWMPVAPLLTEGRANLANLSDIGVLFVIGRITGAATPSLIERELDELARHFEWSGTPRFGTGVYVRPFLDHVFGPVRAALWWLLGAVAVLLAIACGNLSALSLTQALRRRRQQAVCIALGASGRAFWRPVLVETLGIATIAAAAGLVAAQRVMSAVARLAPDDVPRLGELSMSWPLAGLMIVSSLACALVSCAAPMLRRGTRTLVLDLQDTAHSTASRRSMRAQSLLLCGQIALTVVLLAATGLIVRSYTNLRQLDLGFDPQNVVTLHVETQQTSTPYREWMRELLTRIEAIEGIDAAGAVLVRPLALGAVGADTLVMLEGQPLTGASTRANPGLNYQVATPGYFHAMKVALKQGRLFTANDQATSPRVVLVSESTARRLWPGQNPIGKRLVLPSMDPPPDPNGAAGTPAPIWRTVVGIVADVRYRGLDEVRFDVYEPSSQARSQAGHVVVRSASNPVAMASAVQAEARRMDSRVLISSVTTMEAVVSRSLAAWRLSAWMLSAFAVMALVLAGFGVFGVIALDSAQRSREFALRMALGAQARDIGRRVLLSAARHAVPGLLGGIAIAAAGSRWMSSLLFQTDPFDPITYVLVVGVLAVSIAMASVLPAYRASRTDPATLLKQE
jgi:putative ABC transport system permease protein